MLCELQKLLFKISLLIKSITTQFLKDTQHTLLYRAKDLQIIINNGSQKKSDNGTQSKAQIQFMRFQFILTKPLFSSPFRSLKPVCSVSAIRSKKVFFFFVIKEVKRQAHDLQGVLLFHAKLKGSFMKGFVVHF